MKTTNDNPTARDTRLKLNKLEKWFRSNEMMFSPEDRMAVRYLLEVADRPQHVALLEEVFFEVIRKPYSREEGRYP